MQAVNPNSGATANGNTNVQAIPQAPPRVVHELGLTAWLQVVVSFFACMNTFGFATAYGLFETFYTDALQKSPFQIAWIGVLPIFFTAFIGIYSSGLADRGCCFSSLLIGCVLQMLGLVLASSVDLQGKLPYLSILAYQGIISGVGNGLVFSPTMWLVSTHFKSRQDLALGIAALGIPVGGIIYTVIGQQLIPIVGIQITLRFMCSVFAVGNIVIITAARPVSRLANPVGNPLFEFSPFKRIDFTFFNLGTYLTHVGLWAVVLYLPAYAFQVLKLDVNGSFNAIIIMNICGILGRVLGPCLSYYALGPQFLHALCTLFSSVVIFCWIAVHNVKGFYIFAGSFGFFSSAVQILFRAACTSLCDDQTRIGASISTSYFMMSTAFLIGGPLGGAVLNLAPSWAYLSIQFLAGHFYSVGGLCLLAAWILRRMRIVRREREMFCNRREYLKMEPRGGRIVQS